MSAPPPVPSYAQVRRLRALAAEQAEGLDPTGKTIPLLFVIPGELDVSALEEAVSRLVARHPALHHRFTDGEMPSLTYAGPARVRCDVTVAADLVADPADRDALDAAVVRRIRAEVDRPFDALGWPLLRIGVVRADQALCYVSVDHLVADAWSQWAVMLELSALYDAVLAGRDDPLPPAPDFYAFSAAQRRRFHAGPGLQAPVAALRRSLSGRPLHPPFPLDVPWDDDRGRYVRRQLLGPEAAQRLTDWCRDHRATLFMAVLGAFGIALREVCDTTEVGVLFATHNRDDEVRGGIGWYANMLPVYFPVGGDVAGTVAEVRRALIATLEFHELPLARAVDLLPPEQADDGHPTCFVSMTDDRTGQRQDGPQAPDVPVDPETAWRRMAIAPAHRRGYGIWISLMDEGVIVSTASPAVRGDADHLDRLETAFAAVLSRMAG